jgi:hypothetical protein
VVGPQRHLRDPDVEGRGVGKGKERKMRRIARL